MMGAATEKLAGLFSARHDNSNGLRKPYDVPLLLVTLTLMTIGNARWSV